MVPDQVIFLLVQENIELACQAIEKAAMDRAVIEDMVAQESDVVIGKVWCTVSMVSRLSMLMQHIL